MVAENSQSRKEGKKPPTLQAILGDLISRAPRPLLLISQVSRVSKCKVSKHVGKYDRLPWDAAFLMGVAGYVLQVLPALHDGERKRERERENVRINQKIKGGRRGHYAPARDFHVRPALSTLSLSSARED